MSLDLYGTQTDLFPPELVVRKVGANCHVSFDGVSYSVPHAFYNEMVIVRASVDAIDILDNNGQRIASHARSSAKRRYVTDPTHMPASYYSLFYDERYDGAKLRSWAKKIGKNTFLAIDTLLKRQQIEQHAYKTCMAILQLTKKHSSSRLESACACALANKSVSFAAIQRFIKTEIDKRNFL